MRGQKNILLLDLKIIFVSDIFSFLIAITYKLIPWLWLLFYIMNDKPKRTEGMQS